MKNENENNGKSVKKMAEELIDKLIAQMEESGATIDGFKSVIAAIERRKKQLNEANHEEDRKQDDVDERIKIVRRTLSSEVKNGIVIAMNEDKNGSPESVIFAKGENDDDCSDLSAQKEQHESRRIYRISPVCCFLRQKGRGHEMIDHFADAGKMVGRKTGEEVIDDEIAKRDEQQARRRQKADMNRRYVDILTNGMKGGKK